MHPEPGDPSDAALIWADEARRAADAAVDERIEVESAVTPWSALVVAAQGQVVEAATSDGVHHSGRLTSSGDGWVVVETASDHRLLLLDRIISMAGLGVAAPAPRVTLGPGSVLRRWSQLDSVVAVHLVDGSLVHGRITAVFADAIGLRTDTPSGRLVLPLRGVVWASAASGFADS